LRAVIWTDRAGYRRRSLVRDEDPDDAAAQGLPSEPPNVERIDWDDVKRDIHNQLMDAGMVTWLDVQRGQNKLAAIVKSVVLRRVVALYREPEQKQE